MYLCSNLDQSHEMLYSEDSSDGQEKELEEKFEKLTSNEQHEARMILCDKLCKAYHGYNRCTDEDYQEYGS